MRPMILATLVLLPVMASAQARTSTELQQSPSSAVVEAELNRPTLPASVGMKAEAKAALPSRSLAMVSASRPASFHESVQTRTMDSFADAALRRAGTLEFGMASAATEFAPARITRAEALDLSEQEMAAEPAVSTVVLHAVVDENGVARNVAVTQSAGSVMDRKAIAALGEFRFQPATRDNKPAATTVAVSIRIAK